MQGGPRDRVLMADSTPDKTGLKWAWHISPALHDNHPELFLLPQKSSFGSNVQ